MTKESSCQCRRHKKLGFNPWVRKIAWRRKWQPTPVFLPGKFHAQKSLVDYNPWGRRVIHNSVTNTHTGKVPRKERTAYQKAATPCKVGDSFVRANVHT